MDSGDDIAVLTDVTVGSSVEQQQAEMRGGGPGESAQACILHPDVELYQDVNTKW